MRKLISLLVVAIVGTVVGARSAQCGAMRISQIYVDGGDDVTAYYNTSWVELLNASGSPVDLSGWFLASGGNNATSSFGCAGCTFTFPAGVTVAPCTYLLIQVGPAIQGKGLPLNAPDLTFPSTTLASRAGSLGLLSGVFPAGHCLSGPQLQDLVGWSLCFSGTPAPSGDDRHSMLRLAQGLTQTGNNGNDFVLATPNPRNSSSAQSPLCLQTPARSSSWGTLKSVYR